MSRTALVTGITGQDGGYLAARLLDDGWIVHGTAQAPNEDVPDGLVMHVLDLSEPGIGALVTAVQPTLVVSLASISSVGMSWEQPALVGRVNGIAVMELLAAADALCDVRVVHAASAEIFGDSAEVPQRASTRIAPSNPYGASKAYAAEAVRMYRARGMHASNAILYNHESPRRPERFVSRKITAAVARIARGEQRVLELGNLDARRDFGWAPDTVDAMVRIAQHERPGDWIVATGKSHSVREFLAAAFAAAGIYDWERFVRVDAALVRPTDAAEQRGDSSSLRALGWRPTKSFEEVVAAMVEHDLALLDKCS